MSRYIKFWRNADKETREKYAMTNRAKKYKCPVIIPFTKREIVKRDGLKCYICSMELTFETATIDHFIPLSKGGFHCPSNAKIACLKCNQEKGSKI